VDDQRYVPPPAFAPPAQRVAPLNETAVLGRTTYPHGPYAQPARYAPAVPTSQGWHRAPAGRPPARSQKWSILISVGVFAAVIAIGVALLAGSGTATIRTLSLPDSVDDYVRVSTLDGSQIRSMFATGGAFGSIATTDLSRALVGVYTNNNDGEPSLLFIGFTAEDSPSLGPQLHAGPADRVAGEVLAGAAATTTPVHVDAGPFGGAIRCATIALSGELASVGVWADHDTLGIVMVVESFRPGNFSSTSIDRTGELTRDIRNAAEH
jgi:hypothetical protein